MEPSKIVILLCIIICAISCSADTMLEKMELEFYDKDLVDISISNRNVNQSFTVANIITTFLQPLVDKSVVKLSAYVFVGKQYRLSPVRFAKPLKEILNYEQFDVKALFQKYSKPPMLWPLDVNVTYRIIDYYPNSAAFPKAIPGGRYRANIKCYSDANYLFSVNYFLKINA